MVNLDTHIFIAAVEDRLRPAERQVLDDDAWCVSDIVVWELARLFMDGRTKLRLEHRETQRVLGRMTIWPISYAVGMALRRLDFRSDPADEIIAATSIAHGVPLLTRDNRILGSKVVPFAVLD